MLKATPRSETEWLTLSSLLAAVSAASSWPTFSSDTLMRFVASVSHCSVADGDPYGNQGHGHNSPGGAKPEVGKVWMQAVDTFVSLIL